MNQFEFAEEVQNVCLHYGGVPVRDRQNKATIVWTFAGPLCVQVGDMYDDFVVNMTFQNIEAACDMLGGTAGGDYDIRTGNWKGIDGPCFKWSELLAALCRRLDERVPGALRTKI